MADDVCLQIDNALNAIVDVTDKGRILKKVLKYDVHETVSELRKLVATLKSNIQETKESNQRMAVEVKQLKEAVLEEKPTNQPRQVATSSNCHAVLNSRGTAAFATPCCENETIF